MTEKQSYENVLRELRKVKAPSLHLEDYNYWMNKGIQEYCNERYNVFQTTQQLSDDLQPLISFATVTITQSGLNYTGIYSGDFVQPIVPVSTGVKYGSDYYRFKSPDNYWHTLGVHLTSQTRKIYKCYPRGYKSNMPAKRLTQDTAVSIINNSFLKPDFKRPYFSFHDGSLNSVKPDLLVFIGNKTNFVVTDVVIDYLKEPKKVNLTKQQRDLPIDSSSIMEFSEYVCNEIVKRIVKLILEVGSDPRLQTHIPINKSIP